VKAYLPAHVRKCIELKLTSTEMHIRETIFHFTKSNGKGCWFTNATWGELLGLSEKQVSRAIVKLEKAKLIDIVRGTGLRKRTCRTTQTLVSSEAPKVIEQGSEVVDKNVHDSGTSQGESDPRGMSPKVPKEKPNSLNREKKSAQGASRLDLIKEMNLKAEELILGEDGLFGDEKAPAWREKLLGWVKDRIDPSRVQIVQPKKPTKIVNLPQLTKIANQANKWEKEIAASNGSADLLEAAVVESIDEASVNGWSSIHPEKEFEAIFRKVVKVEDRARDEVAEYVVETLGGSKFKDYGPMKFAKEKVTGRTLGETKSQVGYVKHLVKEYGLKVTLSQKIAVLFSGPEGIAGDLLSPDQLRQWKKDRGDL